MKYHTLSMWAVHELVLSRGKLKPKLHQNGDLKCGQGVIVWIVLNLQEEQFWLFVDQRKPDRKSTLCIHSALEKWITKNPEWMWPAWWVYRNLWLWLMSTLSTLDRVELRLYWSCWFIFRDNLPLEDWGSDKANRFNYFVGLMRADYITLVNSLVC